MLAVLNLIAALQPEAVSHGASTQDERAAIAEIAASDAACAAGLPTGVKPNTKDEWRCEMAAREAAAIADSMAASAYEAAQAERLLIVCEALKVEAIGLRPMVLTIRDEAERRRAHDALDRMGLAYREACL